MLMEILAHKSYRELEYPVHFWRTKSGLEVDFVLGDAEVADRGEGHHARRHARTFARSEPLPKTIGPERRSSCATSPRHAVCTIGIDGPVSLPWRDFLARLWAGEILG